MTFAPPQTVFWTMYEAHFGRTQILTALIKALLFQLSKSPTRVWFGKGQNVVIHHYLGSQKCIFSFLQLIGHSPNFVPCRPTPRLISEALGRRERVFDRFGPFLTGFGPFSRQSRHRAAFPSEPDRSDSRTGRLERLLKPMMIINALAHSTLPKPYKPGTVSAVPLVLQTPVLGASPDQRAPRIAP